jgi:hypothetical protein
MQVDVTDFGVELQDLFASDGGRVASPADWPRRRTELAEILLRECYGHLPSAPAGGTPCECVIERPLRLLDGIRHAQYRLFPLRGSDFAMTLDVYAPPSGNGPFPVIVDGDGCWRSATDAVVRRVAGRGYALAQFNRCEVVPDIPKADRSSRFERLHPGSDFGAVAAWAWGFHRVVEALPAIARVDPARAVVVGHSRGGKASLLAGALDERIAVVAANGSGSGGAGCWRFNGPNAEPLDHMLKAFPTWFTPALGRYRGRQASLPFDQHFLKALCAPRPLLCTESLDDLWANPAGTCITHRAAREAYRLLGAPADRLGLGFRTGPHAHDLVDWDTLLDFCDLHFFDKPAPRDFLREPFDHLPAAFSWRAP